MDSIPKKLQGIAVALGAINNGTVKVSFASPCIEIYKSLRISAKDSESMDLRRHRAKLAFIHLSKVTGRELGCLP
jgi:hypothetical protein